MVILYLKLPKCLFSAVETFRNVNYTIGFIEERNFALEKVAFLCKLYFNLVLQFSISEEKIALLFFIIDDKKMSVRCLVLTY